MSRRTRNAADRSRSAGESPIWARPEPGERRARRAREQIAQAAIAIADAEGFEAVSMRRIAAELGAGTMTLYHYVAQQGRAARAHRRRGDGRAARPGGRAAATAGATACARSRAARAATSCATRGSSSAMAPAARGHRPERAAPLRAVARRRRRHGPRRSTSSSSSSRSSTTTSSASACGRSSPCSRPRGAGRARVDAGGLRLHGSAARDRGLPEHRAHRGVQPRRGRPGRGPR